MRVYWRKVRWGQNLILSDEEGFQTIEEAKAFVESFRPWELYGAQGVSVESEVMPVLDSASAGTTVVPDQPAKSKVPEVQPTKRWWEFWKKT